MKVVLCKPHALAQITDIEESLKSIQRVVEGIIEIVYPFEDNAVLVCNDEGKINHLPLNRPLFDSKGNFLDIIAGTFFICAYNEKDLASLSDEQAEKYFKKFWLPLFFNKCPSEGHLLKE